MNEEGGAAMNKNFPENPILRTTENTVILYKCVECGHECHATIGVSFENTRAIYRIVTKSYPDGTHDLVGVDVVCPSCGHTNKLRKDEDKTVIMTFDSDDKTAEARAVFEVARTVFEKALNDAGMKDWKLCFRNKNSDDWMLAFRNKNSTQ